MGVCIGEQHGAVKALKEEEASRRCDELDITDLTGFFC